jgi:hypothetical protein
MAKLTLDLNGRWRRWEELDDREIDRLRRLSFTFSI